MSEADFLAKLYNNGKLQVVEPSEEIKQAYFQKSQSYLISAKLLFDNSRLEESVSMAYYSMYYSAPALFFKVGIKCENHSAAIIPLNAVFGIDGAQPFSAKTERIDKQHYVNFSITRKETEDLIKTAEMFDSKIFDLAEKINSEKMIALRNNLIALLDSRNKFKTQQCNRAKKSKSLSINTEYSFK